MQLKKKQINKNTNLLLILISIFESRDSQFLLSLFFELFSLKQTKHRADCQASTNLERCGSNQKKIRVSDENANFRSIVRVIVSGGIGKGGKP
jgi:hypothetical protein